VNGKFCRDPKLANANDFFFQGLNIPRSTANQLGSNVTLLTADQILGLNTLGVSLARIDFAPYGLNPPHTHPRATKILVVVEGTLLVGFVTSNPDNRLITKTLNSGDVFVFPIGLIHFQPESWAHRHSKECFWIQSSYQSRCSHQGLSIGQKCG
jgi:quercetin dioxygenase-like cupin family protein